MNESIKHRGPDDAGVYINESIALGHVRLSIIDVSNQGHQPMSDTYNQFTITYNGELYNYLEIKENLKKDYTFKTNSDTEVILAAYKKFGVDCFNHFNGMFALAIWDSEKEELILARDRVGIKPLYYSYSAKRIIFSSEIKGILSTGYSTRKLNRNFVPEYLAYQTVHCPNTLVEDIAVLEPGTYLKLNKNLKVDKVKYWSPKRFSTPGLSSLTYDQAKNKVRELFERSVKRRLVSDVPVSAFLSGGIDSSAVVGVASKLINGRLDTFTVSFDDQEFSEAKYAQLVSDRFNTNHHEIKLKPNYLLDNLTDALDFMDHPSTDGPNTFIISKKIKEFDIKVALSGLGGDELFAGYDLFKRTMSLMEKVKYLKKSPAFLPKIFAGFLGISNSIGPKKLAQYFSQQQFDFQSSYAISRQAMLNKDINEILEYPQNTSHPINLSEEQSKHGLISSISQAEMDTYMQNVLLRDTDQMSMAHALEVRVPFLDHELISFVLGLSDKLKYPHTQKKLFVDALSEMIPAEIVNRPKMGFTFPWENWMKNELFEFCDLRIRNLASRKGFNEGAVIKLWEDFIKEKGIYSWSRLWNLVTLEHWIQKNDLK